MKNLFLHFQERRICNLSINMSNKENIIYYKFRSYGYIKDGIIWDDIHQEGRNILLYNPVSIYNYRVFGIFCKHRISKIKDLTSRNFNPDAISNL